MKKVIVAALFITLFSSVAISFSEDNSVSDGTHPSTSSTNINSSVIAPTTPSVIIKDFHETN